MTIAKTKLRLVEGEGRANPASQDRAGRAAPGVAARLRHTATIGFRSATVWPVFTSRTHYGAPVPRGHRAFILGQREWR